MARTKHTDAHLPQRAVLERQPGTPTATASAPDVGMQASQTIDPIWRARLIEYFSLLEDWSKKAYRNEP